MHCMIGIYAFNGRTQRVEQNPCNGWSIGKMGWSIWTDYITSVSHVLKVNGYGGWQAKENEKRQCFKGWETLVHNFTEKYVSKIYKSGQPHQNVNNLIINTCRFCINRDKWGGYKDEKFQQFTISPLKNA